MSRKLEDILEKYNALSREMSDPDVIAQPERWTQCAKEHADISETAEKYLEYKKVEKEMNDAFAAAETEGDRELKDLLTQEGYDCKQRLAAIHDELRILLLPKDKNDERNVVMEIRGGAGGDEASLFAGDLFRMYTKYCESKRWKIEITNYSEGTSGGYKEIVANISGDGVYGIMKYESGVHRVQRVPATETQGRVHTSAATVAVLPEAEEVDVVLNPADIRKDTYCSSGPGGQSVNTTYSAIRLTHIPTGIVVTCQDEKSQLKNLAKAMTELRSRIYAIEHQKYMDEIATKRKTMVSTGDRSAKIRTYNYPQGRVTDHRINLTLYNLAAVMDGEIGEIIEKLQIEENTEKLKESGF